MAADITALPQDPITLADQYLMYQIESDVTPPLSDSFRFVVTVYQDSVSASNLLGKFYLSPNTEDLSFFNLAEAVRGLCQVDDRNYQGTTVIHSLQSKYFTRSNNNIKKFVVGVGEWDGSTETLNDNTATIYLIDGHFQIADGFEPLFSDYYPKAATAKTWLTDRVPASNIVTINAAEEDEGVVAFLNRSLLNGQAISSTVKFEFAVYTESGTQLSTRDITIDTSNGAQSPAAVSPVNGFMCYLAAYPSNIEALTSDLTNNPTWGYYDLIPQTSVFDAQSGNKLRFVKNCRPLKHQAVQLAWSNSVGSWDYLRFDGRKLKTVTREEKNYRKQIGDYNAASFGFTSYDREITPYQVEAKETYQLNGILTSEEYDLFQYCFRSKNIMARIDNGWFPVTLKESSLQVESDTTSKVYIATINVELAQILRC